jgi:hypothetical protein
MKWNEIKKENSSATVKEYSEIKILNREH